MGFLRIAPEFLYGMALYQMGRRLRPSSRQAIVFTACWSGIAALHAHQR